MANRFLMFCSNFPKSLSWLRFQQRNNEVESIRTSAKDTMPARLAKIGLEQRVHRQQKCQHTMYWWSTDGVLNGFFLSSSASRCHVNAHEAEALTDPDPFVKFHRGVVLWISQ